ncbi:MAG: hypothetical protein FOGNACKC_03181 [Anaerolineae bacterium]|nr:hypothetical protein [Anaerolineae bacterium]
MRPRFLFAALSLAALAVYWFSLAPSITWRNNGADSGDLAAAVAVGGVPHPPGFPTYLLLGSLFVRLPVGDVAYRLNLLSAVAAALTVALIGLILRRLLARHGDYQLAGLCAATAALLLAFTPLFWSQAVITEVYTVTTLAATLLLWLALQISPGNQRWLLPTWAAILGLSLGTHLSILLFLPVLLAALNLRWRRSLLLPAVAAFGAGLAVYLLLPWRASTQPPVNWGAATSGASFFELVTAQIYRPYLLAAPASIMWARASGSLSLLGGGLGWWGLPPVLLGLTRLWQAQRRLAMGSLVSTALFVGYALSYNTADSVVYLLPALLLAAIWLGWGLFDAGQALAAHIHIPRGAGWALLALPLLVLGLNFPQQNLSRDTVALQFARQKLESAPANAVILVEDDAATFALWYGRYGLNLRPDTAIVNSNLLAFDWYRRTLQATHPRLLLADPAGTPTRSLEEFTRWNRSAAPLQYTFNDITNFHHE